MPLSRPDQHTADQIKKGAGVLRAAGEKDCADIIEGLLTPVGAAFIQRFHADRPRVNLSMNITDLEVDHYRAAARASGDGLSALADQGLYLFVEGEFRPTGMLRRRVAGLGIGASSLTLKVDQGLRDQAVALLGDPEFTAGLPWNPEYVGTVVHAYLQEQFPLVEGITVPELTETYEGGKSVAQLARQLKVDKTAILFLLQANRVRLRKTDLEGQAETAAAVDPELRDQDIFRRYRAGGVSKVQLSREFGVHPNTVQRALERQGAKARKPAIDPERYPEIIRRNREGVTAAELAQEFGVHPNTIYKITSEAKKKNS